MEEEEQASAASTQALQDTDAVAISNQCRCVQYPQFEECAAAWAPSLREAALVYLLVQEVVDQSLVHLATEVETLKREALQELLLKLGKEWFSQKLKANAFMVRDRSLEKIVSNQEEETPSLQELLKSK
jgi:hypothetical protein